MKKLIISLLIKNIKAIHLLLMGILCILATSCGSDEPNAPYPGPWEVCYAESYSEIHNNTQEFIDWFNLHLNDFVVCKFVKGDTYYQFDDYVELDDYKNYPIGYIEWIEIVDRATEDEIKSKVAQFESFTIKDPKSQLHYDIFKAGYQKYDGK